jgi:hypothetical protein
MVPSRFSSAIILIVTAGIRNIKTHGEMKKSASSPAYPLSSIFNSPGKTHMNILLIRRKTIITIYPVRLLKKPLISFLKIANIYLFSS